MNKFRLNFRLCVAIICLLFLPACVTSNYGDIHPGSFKGEILSLKKSIKNNPSTLTPGEDHLALACLYSSYKNPKKNYYKALKSIDRHIKLNPDAKDSFEVQNLRTLLKAATRLKSKSELSPKDKELSAKIKVLEETIEKLKDLDIELEKKRKSFK